MNLPPWMKLCTVCKCRYGLESVCPLCQEKAAWADVNRNAWQTTAFVAVAIVAWLSLFLYLLSRLP